LNSTYSSRRAHSGVRWVILALLFAASFIAYILRTNFSIAGESMMTELGLTQLQLGMILAAFAWGYAIFQFPGGVLGDMIGGRRALTYIALGWGALNILTGLVPGGSHSITATLIGLVALRFLMGAVQAPLYPVTGGGTTCAWFPVSGWALPNGITNAGLTLGAAATGPLIAWLTNAVGWRQSFILTAPLGFLIAGLWWGYARDTPVEHPRVSQAELDVINRGRLSIHCGKLEPGAWKQVLQSPQVLLLTASYFCSNYVFYFFFNWLFIYLIDNRHFKTLEGGYHAAIPWIAGAIGAAVGGLVCDELCKRLGMGRGTRITAMIGLGVAAAFILLAASAQSAILAVLFLSICLGGQQLTEGAFWAATIAVSGQRASAACGVLNTGGNAVGGLGALLVPVVVQSLGWPAALASASLFAGVAGGLWLLINAGGEGET
jgi:ACS family glucarate transporter-like MFS transporter